MRGGDPPSDFKAAFAAYLFPACAGVILPFCPVHPAVPSFPRMRGGDPGAISLHTEYTTLFPAWAGLAKKPQDQQEME